MKFLIVAPGYKNKVGQHYEFPLGLAYISSILKNKGYQVECLNLNYHEPAEIVLENAIIGGNIDVICTGGLSVHFKKIKAILDAAKNIKPDIISIIGGGLVSSEPELILKTLNADFGVIGEGEESIVELADAIINSKDLSVVNGIIYNTKNEGLIITKARKPIEDIDSIPYPDYEGFEVDKYLDMQMPADDHYLYPFDKPRMLPIISSRSCPYNCTFCFHPLGNKYRQRSLDAFFAEVEFLVEHYDINMIAVLDELFAVDYERTKEFCIRIKKFNIKWMTQMRVDRVTEELLRLLKDSGCIQISYGVESASDIVLKSMKKHTSLSQIKKALELTYKAQIGIQGNFIFGDISETWETANETLQWWLENKKYQINLSLVVPYPGSELYNKAIDKDLIKDKIKFIEDECPPLNLTQMSDDKFFKLLRLIEHYRVKYDRFPARMLSCKKEGVDLYKGSYYSIEVECPHCHKISKYKNMHQRGIGVLMTRSGCRLGCRECNQRFDLSSFQPIDLKLKKSILNLIIYLPDGIFSNIYQPIKKYIRKNIYHAKPAFFHSCQALFRRLKREFTRQASEKKRSKL